MSFALTPVRHSKSLSWERLDAKSIPSKLYQALASCASQDPDWQFSAHGPVKKVLKDFLFLAQQSECAYCRREIKDEEGHVEIDHILPKKERGKFSNWSVNHPNKRRATSGYPSFTFEPLNLVLTCKRCNNRKGTYDSRKDRSIPVPSTYPMDPDDFVWVHPYLHEYSEHICMHLDFIFLPV